MRRRRADIERRIAEREALYAAILGHAAALPDGTPMRSRDFAPFGEPAEINRALAHLSEVGRLLRVGRGIYMRPIDTRFGKRAPVVDQIVEGIARLTGEAIARHGAMCARNLGLAVPGTAAAMYLTSGRSRRLTIGDQRIELQHAPRWLIDIPVPRAGNVVRALAWLGPDKADQAVRILERRLPPIAIEELAAVDVGAPEWLSQTIGTLVDSLRRIHGTTSA